MPSIMSFGIKNVKNLTFKKKRFDQNIKKCRKGYDTRIKENITQQASENRQIITPHVWKQIH